MNLIWHMVKKDVRHLAAPVALWIGFIVAGTSWFAHFSISVGADPTVSFGLLVHWSRMLAGLFLVTGYLIAGYAVLQDPLVETTAFWKTRPISNARNFAAKSLSVVFLFVALPALALVPVWMIMGFSGREILLAAGEFMVWQALITLLAPLVAGVTSTLAQFLFWSVVVIVAHVAVGSQFIVGHYFKDLPPWLSFSRSYVIQYLLIVPPAIAVVGHQFLTLRTRRSWTLVALTLALTFAVRVAWPWNVQSWLRGRGSAERPEDRDMAAEVSGSASSRLFTVTMHGPPSSSLVYAPRSGSVDLTDESGQTATVFFSTPRTLPPEIVQAVLSGTPYPEESSWPTYLAVKGRKRLVGRTGSPRVSGDVLVSVLEGRVLGQLSVAVGGVLDTGPSALRIVAIEREPESDRPVALAIELRDVRLGLRGGMRLLGRASLERANSVREAFVLRNSRTGLSLLLNSRDHDNGVYLSSILIEQRQLELPPDIRSEDLAGATLTRVRFEQKRVIRRELPPERIAVDLEKEGKAP